MHVHSLYHFGNQQPFREFSIFTCMHITGRPNSELLVSPEIPKWNRKRAPLPGGLTPSQKWLCHSYFVSRGGGRGNVACAGARPSMPPSVSWAFSSRLSASL